MRTRLCRGGLVVSAVAFGVVALSSCAGKELEPFGSGETESSGASSTSSSTTSSGAGLTSQVNTSTLVQTTGSSTSGSTSGASGSTSTTNTSTGSTSTSASASTSGVGQTSTGSSNTSTTSPSSTTPNSDTTPPNDSSLPSQSTSTQSSGGTTSTPGPDTSEPPTSGPIELDCNAAMPTAEGDLQQGNGTGGTGNLAWEIWSNTGEGELMTYDVPAFSAIWNEAGGYLGRLGYEWSGPQGNPGPYESLGTITAQFVANKSGSGGDVYSYIGMYGWSTDPCVEWYVIEDSFRPMPVNPGTTTLKSDEVVIDGEEYNIYTRPTMGSGGTRCSGVTEWIQYYSIRKTARSCGQISLTQHFDAWKELQMPLGDLLEAKILAEVGGGVGRVDFPIANVIVTPP